MKLLFSAVLLTLVLFSACKDDSTSPPSGTPGANEVLMSGNSFSPSSITVTRGTTVKWINRDNVAHTVTSGSSLAFDSGNLGRDGTFSFKFDSTGTYPYFCRLHAGMTGNVIVQ